mgnify:FL=1
MPGKTIFLTEKLLSDNPENRYISLIDVFDEDQKILNAGVANDLLASDFGRKLCVEVALHQNAGAAIFQQLGIALAKAHELTEHFGEEIIPKLVFRIAIGSNYFFEIAKIRALKLLVNQWSKEFGLNEVPYIFAETSHQIGRAHV